MRISVSSVVVFEVPDESDLASLRLHFMVSHQIMIGIPMKTLSGQPYKLLAIDRLDVDRRAD